MNFPFHPQATEMEKILDRYRIERLITLQVLIIYQLLPNVEGCGVNKG